MIFAPRDPRIQIASSRMPILYLRVTRRFAEQARAEWSPGRLDALTSGTVIPVTSPVECRAVLRLLGLGSCMSLYLARALALRRAHDDGCGDVEAEAAEDEGGCFADQSTVS